MRAIKSIIIFGIAFILLAALCLIVSAEDSNLTYIDKGTYIEITGCSEDAETVIIPSEIDSKPVTTICGYAFKDATKLSTITLPDSITYMGQGAFQNCTKLTKVCLSSALTTISQNAFDGCSELKTIFIPKSVLSIGDGAFSDCNKLTDIYYDGTEAQFNSIFIYSTNQTLWYKNLHPMHQHTTSAWVQSIPLGQYTDGEEIGYCDECGYKVTRVIKNTHTHERNYKVVTAATCTAEGIGTYSCPCGATYTEIIQAKGHDFSVKVISDNNFASPPDCSTGAKYFYKCKNCQTFSDTLTFESGDADYDNHMPYTDYTIDVQPTCTKNGKSTLYCVKCKTALDSQIIKASGHKIKIDKFGTAATCTNNGKTDSTSCTVCKEILTVQEVIPAKGHTEVTVPGRAATCSAVGLTDGKRCSVCDKTILKQYEIAKTAHVESEWIVQKPATEKATGIEIKRCTLCNKKLEERVIPVQEAKYILGDINGDGKVTASDARIILRIATKLENASKYKNAQVIADVNGDGKISSLDARKVLRVASRLESF